MIGREGKVVACFGDHSWADASPLVPFSLGNCASRLVSETIAVQPSQCLKIVNLHDHGTTVPSMPRSADRVSLRLLDSRTDRQKSTQAAKIISQSFSRRDKGEPSYLSVVDRTAEGSLRHRKCGVGESCNC